MIVVRGIAVLDINHADRLIDGWAVDVLVQQVVVAVVLGDDLIAIVEVLHHRLAVIRLLDPPARGIVGVRDRLEVVGSRPLDVVHPRTIAAADLVLQHILDGELSRGHRHTQPFSPAVACCQYTGRMRTCVDPRPAGPCDACATLALA